MCSNRAVPGVFKRQLLALTVGMARNAFMFLNTPLPDESSIQDLADELGTHAGICEQKLEGLSRKLALINVQDAFSLKNLTKEGFSTICQEAGFTNEEMEMVQVCLGTQKQPHEFGDPKQEGIGAKKGGSLKEVAGFLVSRRPPIQGYYPPPIFDTHSLEADTRNETELRICIVKEIEEFCGDLYPDDKEKEVILGAITTLCGPPAGRCACILVDPL